MDGIQLFFITFNLMTTLLLLPHPLNYFYLMLKSRSIYHSLRHSNEKSLEKKQGKPHHENTWPMVVVQLPVYNEGKIILRLLEACCRLQYQQDKCIIQILDDSTDETPRLIRQWLHQERCQHQVQVHQGCPNKHYKAGALQHGLSRCKNAKYAAIFDADFIPHSNFLKEMISYLEANPRVAAVQARWTHENENENILTRAIAVSLDMHFLVEKLGQQAGGYLQQFNGAGGIWRIQSIHEVGGWKARTIAEDLDLVFRIQLSGKLIHYAPWIKVSQKIPSNYRSFLIQQNRWAQGFSQNLKLHLVSTWKNQHLTMMQKIEATLLLTSYLFSAIIFLNILSLIGLIWTNSIILLFQPPLFPWSLIPAFLISVTTGLGFFAYYEGARRGGRSRLQALFGVVAFSIISGSMLLSILISCVLGILKPERTFERTPKSLQQEKRIKHDWKRTLYWTIPDIAFLLILIITIIKILNTVIFWGYIPALLAICLGISMKIISLIRSPLPVKRR